MVIADTQPGANADETILSCDDLGDEYKKNITPLYEIQTSKLVCTVASNRAQRYRVGDYIPEKN